MPNKPEPHAFSYVCECGKRWSLASKENAKVECTCGRTIVLRHGFAYSSGKA